jgi:hypothetical protein
MADVTVTCPVCKGTKKMTLHFRARHHTFPPTSRLIECAFCIGVGTVQAPAPEPLRIDVDDAEHADEMLVRTE